MPIYAECDICGKKYRFADDQGGMTVPCKECTADFDVIKPPFFDRRVLVGVGVTVGAMVGLFLIAVIVIEIVSASRGASTVAVTPSTPAPLPTHSHNTTTPNAASAVPPSLPRLNLPPAPSNGRSTPNPFPQTTIPPVSPPVSVPPNAASGRSNSPFLNPPVAGVPLKEAPVIRTFQPTTVAENAELKIQGEHLRKVGIIQFLSIRDPKVRAIAPGRTRTESEVTFRVPINLVPQAIDSELFVVTASFGFGYSVTVPRRVVEWQEGQPLPADYETLVYVRPNSQRRVGAGHHMIFVESGATVELDGTSGQIFLGPGARIGSMNNIGMLQITADMFDRPPNSHIGMQLGYKVVFSVVEDLVRITKASR